MRIAFVADGRAEHARRWIQYFTASGDEVLVLSTYPCSEIRGAKTRVLPGIFRPGDTLVKRPASSRPSRPALVSARVMRRGLNPRIQSIWQQVRTLDVLWQARAARKALDAFRPDVTHAMRVQNEGYVAALSDQHPLILSTWGSDFIFQARSYPLHGLLTPWAVRKPDLLLADCNRDIRLAHAAGLARSVPAHVFPGNGGVDFSIHTPGVGAAQRERIVVYPRGLVVHASFDVLLESIQKLYHRSVLTGTRFMLLVQPALVTSVRKMVRARSLPFDLVHVRPYLCQSEWVALMRRAAVLVSPMLSDGTPNSMLEAMACGVFPVMSNIESIREWITHRVNGLLFDPTDSAGLAECLVEALDTPSMRQAAQKINLRLVREHADYAEIMPRVRELYDHVARSSTSNRSAFQAAEAVCP